jgi:hypothetical protein
LPIPLSDADDALSEVERRKRADALRRRVHAPPYLGSYSRRRVYRGV